MRGAVEGSDGCPRARRRSPRESEGVADGPHAGLFLSSSLSSMLEGGRRPSWAQLPNMCLRFYGDLSTPIRVSLIVVPDRSITMFAPSLYNYPIFDYWFKFFPTLGSEFFSCPFYCYSNRWISALRLVKTIVNLNITHINIFVETYCKMGNAIT